MESRGPAFAQAVGAGGRDRNGCGILVAVTEEYRTGGCLLGREDAPFVPHRQPAVQSFQDLHRRPGIAGAFRTWQQLDGVQLEPNRVVPGHFPAVLEAQDLFQAQLRVQRPECRLRVLRGNWETLVEPRQVSRAAAKHTTVAERKCTTEIMADDTDSGVGVATGTVGRRPWESYAPACSGADDAVASCRLPLSR